MISKAMYLGAKKVDLPERTNNDGTTYQALKGTTYTFFANKWKKDILKEQGFFMNMFVSEEDEQPELEKGQLYDIEIIDIDKRRCKLYNEDEEDEE